jgi:hypothetical protein
MMLIFSFSSMRGRYCLPMADTTRPFLKTDEEFFDLEGVGNGEFTILALSLTNILPVPVIAIFTKCDGLVTEVHGALLAGGMHPNESNMMCIEKVEHILTTRFKELQQRAFAPAAHVNTRGDVCQMEVVFSFWFLDMGTPRRTTQKKAFAATQKDCVKKLVQVTAGAVTNEALQLLFVSVQQNNLELCAFYAIRRFCSCPCLLIVQKYE